MDTCFLFVFFFFLLFSFLEGLLKSGNEAVTLVESKQSGARQQHHVRSQDTKQVLYDVRKQ